MRHCSPALPHCLRLPLATYGRVSRGMRRHRHHHPHPHHPHGIPHAAGDAPTPGEAPGGPSFLPPPLQGCGEHGACSPKGGPHLSSCPLPKPTVGLGTEMGPELGWSWGVPAAKAAPASCERRCLISLIIVTSSGVAIAMLMEMLPRCPGPPSMVPKSPPPYPRGRRVGNGDPGLAVPHLWPHSPVPGDGSRGPRGARGGGAPLPADGCCSVPAPRCSLGDGIFPAWSPGCSGHSTGLGCPALAGVGCAGCRETRVRDQPWGHSL